MNIWEIPFTTPTKDWIDILGAIATPIIAILVGRMTYVISRHQTGILEKEFKLKSYEQFKECHNLTKQAISDAIQSGNLGNANANFWKAHEIAMLYLDKKLAEFLKELVDMSNKSMSIHMRLLSLPSDEERKILCTEQAKLMAKLTSIESINNLFSNYSPYKENK